MNASRKLARNQITVTLFLLLGVLHGAVASKEIALARDGRALVTIVCGPERRAAAEALAGALSARAGVTISVAPADLVVPANHWMMAEACASRDRLRMSPRHLGAN